MASDVFLARQPIYNRTQHVFGYELFYQNGARPVSTTQLSSGSSKAFIETCKTIGLDHLVGTRSAFVRFSPDFLRGKQPIALPGQSIVLEVAENMVDEALIRGLKRLASKGYMIALSEFSYQPEAAPLLEITNIVKLNIQQLPQQALHHYLGVLHQYAHLKVLADNIDVYEEYEHCREMGFDYFQGIFFSRPKARQRKRLSPSLTALIQLLVELQNPDITVSRLEVLISRDVGLSYKLLRYLNSAFFGLQRPVESLHRAIVYLGIKAIQKWATLLVMSQVDNKPNELMVTATLRAKMCELLAKSIAYEADDVCFTAGLLSVLNALLDMSMENVLATISLSPDLNRALLSYEDVPGEILETVLRYESGQWDQLERGQLNSLMVRDAYIEAVAWTNDACHILIGD